MIIQLLGANGAGKSTIVQEIMGLRERVPLHVWERRVPDAYALPDVIVVGHYEGKTCGGGDTLPRERVLDTLSRLRASYPSRPLLLEGPTGREPHVQQVDRNVRVVYLRKPAAACLGNWLNRQQIKGLGANIPVMEKRIAAGITRIERMIETYLEEDYSVRTFSRRPQVTTYIEELLGRNTDG